MSKLEERESRRRSATVGKFVEQTPMAATSSGRRGRPKENRELKKRGIHHLKVVYSEEPPIPTAGAEQEDPDHPGRRSTPGSVAFVPSVVGLILAGEVVKDLIKTEK